MVFKAIVSWKDEVDNIRALGLEGKTLRQIGLHYGVTKQTISSVVRRLEIFKEGEHFGQSLKAKNKKDAYYKKWGNKDNTSDKYQVCREMFRKKKYNANKLGIEFDIQFGDIDFPEYCPIFGVKLDYFSENGRQENNPTFDRKDPLKGYVTGNVFIVSWRANRIKNDGTAEEHRQIYNWMK